MIARSLLSALPTTWKVGELVSHQYQVTTDSRKIGAENLFLCLKGERFDAFDYLDSLVANEQIKAIIFEAGPGRKELVEAHARKRRDLAFLCVEDSLQALQALAVLVRQDWQAKGGKIFSLTGSNGKTTTKEMLAHFLHAIFGDAVLMTQGNLNNHIGVPLTLLKLTSKHQVAVIEMGTNHCGEIETLARIADPDYGLITNIGAAHIEFLGGLEGVFEEKGALFRSIEAKKTDDKYFVINNDDKFLHLLPVEKWTKRATLVNNFKDYFEFKLGQELYEVKCPHVFERHNRANMMLALSLVMSVFPDKAKQVIESAATFELPKNNRSQVFRDNGHLIYLDAYNANPSSMRASLSSFKERCESERLDLEKVWLVLGDMNEIGDESEHYHREIGVLATELGFKHMVAVGRFSHFYQQSFRGETVPFKTTLEARDFVRSLQPKCEALFIKGSRSLQLESLLDIK